MHLYKIMQLPRRVYVHVAMQVYSQYTLQEDVTCPHFACILLAFWMQANVTLELSCICHIATSIDDASVLLIYIIGLCPTLLNV